MGKERTGESDEQRRKLRRVGHTDAEHMPQESTEDSRLQLPYHSPTECDSGAQWSIREFGLDYSRRSCDMEAKGCTAYRGLRDIFQTRPPRQQHRHALS